MAAVAASLASLFALLMVAAVEGNPFGTPCMDGVCPGYPLPPRQLGFFLSGNPGSKVLLEVYGDNLCSFTKAAYPTLKLLGTHYASEVILHPLSQFLCRCG